MNKITSFILSLFVIVFALPLGAKGNNKHPSYGKKVRVPVLETIDLSTLEIFMYKVTHILESESFVMVKMSKIPSYYTRNSWSCFEIEKDMQVADSNQQKHEKTEDMAVAFLHNSYNKAFSGTDYNSHQLGPDTTPPLPLPIPIISVDSDGRMEKSVPDSAQQVIIHDVTRSQYHIVPKSIYTLYDDMNAMLKEKGSQTTHIDFKNVIESPSVEQIDDRFIMKKKSSCLLSNSRTLLSNGLE